MCSGAQSRSWHHQLGPTVTSSSAFVVWAEALSGLSGLVLVEGLQNVWAAPLFLQRVFFPFWTGKCIVRGDSSVLGTVVNLF